MSMHASLSQGHSPPSLILAMVYSVMLSNFCDAIGRGRASCGGDCRPCRFGSRSRGQERTITVPIPVQTKRRATKNLPNTLEHAIGFGGECARRVARAIQTAARTRFSPPATSPHAASAAALAASVPAMSSLT